MVLDRLRADVQLAGDQGVVLAVCDQLQHLDLAVGQLGANRGRRLRRRRRRAYVLQHLAGDVRRDEGLADRRSLDALHEVLNRRVLQEVTASTREDGVHHVLLLLGDRQHDDPGERRVAAHVAGRLDTSHARHVQIHDHDVRRVLAHDLERLRPARGLADDVDALLLEQVAQTRAEQVVIVHEQDADVMGLLIRPGALSRSYVRLSPRANPLGAAF